MSAFVHVVFDYSDPLQNYVFGDFSDAEVCLERIRTGNEQFWQQFQTREPDLFRDGLSGVRILTLESLGYVRSRSEMEERVNYWRTHRPKVLAAIANSGMAAAGTLPAYRRRPSSEPAAVQMDEVDSQVDSSPRGLGPSEAQSLLAPILQKFEGDVNKETAERIKTVFTEADVEQLVVEWLARHPGLTWAEFTKDLSMPRSENKRLLNEPLPVALRPRDLVWIVRRFGGKRIGCEELKALLSRAA